MSSDFFFLLRQSLVNLFRLVLNLLFVLPSQAPVERKGEEGMGDYRPVLPGLVSVVFIIINICIKYIKQWLSLVSALFLCLELPVEMMAEEGLFFNFICLFFEYMVSC